jgi:hypothetical protein
MGVKPHLWSAVEVVQAGEVPAVRAVVEALVCSAIPMQGEATRRAIDEAEALKGLSLTQLVLGDREAAHNT